MTPIFIDASSHDADRPMDPALGARLDKARRQAPVLMLLPQGERLWFWRIGMWLKDARRANPGFDLETRIAVTQSYALPFPSKTSKAKATAYARALLFHSGISHDRLPAYAGRPVRGIKRFVDHLPAIFEQPDRRMLDFMLIDDPTGRTKAVDSLPSFDFATDALTFHALHMFPGHVLSHMREGNTLYQIGDVRLTMDVERKGTVWRGTTGVPSYRAKSAIKRGREMIVNGVTSTLIGLTIPTMPEIIRHRLRRGDRLADHDDIFAIASPVLRALLNPLTIDATPGPEDTTLYLQRVPVEARPRKPVSVDPTLIHGLECQPAGVEENLGLVSR